MGGLLGRGEGRRRKTIARVAEEADGGGQKSKVRCGPTRTPALGRCYFNLGYFGVVGWGRSNFEFRLNLRFSEVLSIETVRSF